MDWKISAALALALLAPIGLPIVPAVFNRLVHRLATPFRKEDSGPLPHFRTASLLEGLALTACGWFLLGVSLWAMLQAISGNPPAWTWDRAGLFTAFMGVAYVAGFLFILVPSGLGVREFFLTLFLVGPESGQDRATVILAVLALRLVWTTAELVVVGVVYWFPGPARDRIEGDVPKGEESSP
jgi:uncharacterized membrane protein YbhN (UPF0104 family)